MSKTQTQPQQFARMDSFTLFAHIVRYVGSNMCSRAHVELQSLGVLPKASLENNPPLVLFRHVLNHV